MAAGKKLIGIGDKTTTGGVVLSAHLDVHINNQGTATEKCLASCGQCGQNGMIKGVCAGIPENSAGKHIG
jgi:uncharacterized Zn-binding protein involved in type VI secretion